MAWVPAPETIRLFRTSGSGNMGDVTTDTDQKARFTLADAQRFVPVFIRAHFYGSGSTAGLTLKIRSHASFAYATAGDATTGGEHDVALFTADKRGVGADFNLRLVEGDFEGWIFENGDQIVLEWTDPGTNYWGITVALAPFPDYVMP